LSIGKGLGHPEMEWLSSNCSKWGAGRGLERIQVEGEEIMVNDPAKSRSFGSIWQSAGALALALSLSAGAYAQEPQDQPQGDRPQQTQDAPTRPSYAPQDADKLPYSHDRPRQNAQDGPPPQAPAQSVPGTLTVPAGTVLVIRTDDFLSTDRNQVSDQFTATLDQPLIVNGWVVARRGQTIIGKVKEVRKAGRIKGTSELGVELTDMTLVDGRQVPILTELSKGTGGTSHGQDAATIANYHRAWCSDRRRSELGHRRGHWRRSRCRGGDWSSSPDQGPPHNSRAGIATQLPSAGSHSG
jgi:hypothetical protein